MHKESGFSQMFGVEMGEIHQCGTHGLEKLSITLKILDQSYWNNIELSTFPLCSALKWRKTNKTQSSRLKIGVKQSTGRKTLLSKENHAQYNIFQKFIFSTTQIFCFFTVILIILTWLDFSQSRLRAPLCDLTNGFNRILDIDLLNACSYCLNLLNCAGPL